jgi:hypothetical protein
MSQPRRRLDALAGACVAVASVCGCGTTYEATPPQPAVGDGVFVAITAIEATTLRATVELATASPRTIGSFHVGRVGLPGCAAAPSLAVRDVGTGEDLELPAVLDGAATVTVRLPPRALDEPGVTLDVETRPSDSESPVGCVRATLTSAAERVAFHARGPLWGYGLGVRVGVPVHARGGIGASWTAEAVAVRTVRDLRAVFGVSFGWAGCRGDCPELAFANDGDGWTISGLFAHVGSSAGLAGRIPVGPLRLDLTGGVETSFAFLSGVAPGGEDVATQIGPFASLKLTHARSSRVRGFAPALARTANGIELRAARLSTFSRSPTGTAWLLSIGWTFDRSW